MPYRPAKSTLLQPSLLSAIIDVSPCILIINIKYARSLTLLLLQGLCLLLSYEMVSDTISYDTLASLSTLCRTKWYRIPYRTTLSHHCSLSRSSFIISFCSIVNISALYHFSCKRSRLLQVMKLLLFEVLLVLLQEVYPQERIL